MAGAHAKGNNRTVTGYKIVVLGDGGVGKSALTMQFVCNQFLDYHDPTIEDSYQQQARIDGEPAQLDILDTAGQPEFTAMRDQYMRTGEGFIVCYSVIDRRSFEEAIAYKALINRVRKKDHTIPVILVGNKSDLEHLRKVEWEEGKALASQWDCPFLETSAAKRTNVEDTFHGIVREIRKRQRENLNAMQASQNPKQKQKGFKGFFKSLFKKNDKT